MGSSAKAQAERGGLIQIDAITRMERIYAVCAVVVVCDLGSDEERMTSELPEYLNIREINTLALLWSWRVRAGNAVMS